MTSPLFALVGIPIRFIVAVTTNMAVCDMAT